MIHHGERLEEKLPQRKKDFDLHTLVINADNGPESNGRRTQWLERLVALYDAHQLEIQLDCYPPYPSKYNPMERVWGVPENHWWGEIIDSVVPAGEKVFSLFATHTDIIIKGNRVIQYGHKLNLSSGESGLILDVVAEEGNPADTDRLLTMLERHTNRYGCVPKQVAVDDG